MATSLRLAKEQIIKDQSYIYMYYTGQSVIKLAFSHHGSSAQLCNDVSKIMFCMIYLALQKWLKFGHAENWPT